MGEVLAHVSPQEADTERVRFKVYQHKTRFSNTAQLDYRIELKIDPTDYRDTVCIEAAFGNTERKLTIYAIMKLDSACIIDRTYHPDDSSVRVIEDRESTVGIGKMIAALQRGHEIVTTEINRGMAGEAILVVTRMFQVADLHGQDEAEQRETVQMSDPMQQELSQAVKFNVYERRATVVKKLQGSNAETSEACTKESGTRTKCKRCQEKIKGGGFYSDDNGSYGFCDSCITEQASTPGFRFIKSCARCKGLCGAPAIQHVEGCRAGTYSDTSTGGQYHCAPCCVSSGCTCPQRPESFGLTRYRIDRRLPASIRGDTFIGRINRIEPGYGGHEGLTNWEDMHKVYINRSPYGSDGWQDALSMMEGITMTILAQLDGSSEVWREVRDSTRSHTIMEVVFNIPARKLNSFGSGLVIGLDAFINRQDYIGFGHIFNPDSNPKTNSEWEPSPEGLRDVQIRLHRLLHKLVSSPPGTVAWEDALLISYDTDDMRPLGCGACYAGCDECKVVPRWHDNTGTLVHDMFSLRLGYEPECSIYTCHDTGSGCSSRPTDKPGEMTREQERNTTRDLNDIADMLSMMIVEANEFGNENLLMTGTVIRETGATYDIYGYVHDVLVDPIMNSIPLYLFGDATIKIRHIMSRNDYGEGQLWIVPFPCTRCLEELYIRRIGRAIVAILYAPAGTVNMQRLAEQFARHRSPPRGVTGSQEWGEEGTTLGRGAWMDLTEEDARNAVLEEAGCKGEFTGRGGFIFNQPSHTPNTLSFIDMTQTSVEPSIRLFQTDRVVSRMVNNRLNPLRDIIAGLNTTHHNFTILCALGYGQHNTEFNQEGNQQVRKLCAASKQLYVTFICAHTPHYNTPRDLEGYPVPFTDAPSVKYDTKGHELPMAIVRPEFTRRRPPIGLEGKPIDRRNAMDRFARTVAPHLEDGLLQTPEAISHCNLMQVPTHGPLIQVAFNTVTAVHQNGGDSMVMNCALSSYTQNDTTKSTAGTNGEATMDMYDRGHCTSTRNRFGVLGDRFEMEISHCFSEYTSDCTELLREYGAGGNAKERLQWMIRNMDTTIVQMTEFEHHDGTSMTTVDVSHSRVPNNRGYGLVIKRADGTAHLLCKEYNGITNNKNVGHEFASRHCCNVEEVYTFIGNIYCTTWGYNEQWETIKTTDEQEQVMQEVTSRSVVGSGLQTGVKVCLRRMINQEHNFVMLADHETQQVRQEGVLIPPVPERITARNILVRWHILIKVIGERLLEGRHEPQEEVDTFEYTVSETLHNVLQDVEKKGGEQQALARLAFTIYCRGAIEKTRDAAAVLHLTWALISEMITLNSQGKFNEGSIVRSGIKFTEKIPLSRVIEALEVTSTHALYCAGGSDDTKWAGLISLLANNDYSTLDIQTDNAEEEWLPKIYVPVGCVINNNIGGAYKVKRKIGEHGETVHRTILDSRDTSMG